VKARGGVDRSDIGFLLAKASQRWNELLHEQLVAAGFPEVRPSYGSVLVPLFEEDGLRMGEIAARARLSKQTMTTLVRLVERDGLVELVSDSRDRRAIRVHLTARGRELEPVARTVLGRFERAATRTLGIDRLESLRRALVDLSDLVPGAGRASGASRGRHAGRRRVARPAGP
jgi:MarR family transcriptional regulator, organic hydroperoxide resistance regulator